MTSAPSLRSLKFLFVIIEIPNQTYCTIQLTRYVRVPVYILSVDDAYQKGTDTGKNVIINKFIFQSKVRACACIHIG